MNQMTPTEFHDRLTSVMPDEAADGPLQPAIEADILAGRRLLRRRRGATVLGAAAVVAMLAGGVSVVNGFGDEPSRGTDVASPADSKDELLESCRTGQVSKEARRAMFKSGTPVVMAEARTAQRIVLAIESADGRHWAECSLNLAPDAEFASSLTAYGASGRTHSSGYSSGWDCESKDSCRGFSVWLTDRRPDVVASVEFLTADGESTTVETTVDGYVAFAYAGELPEPIAEGQMTEWFAPLKRITFLDESGNPIAAEAMDGSGVGEDHNLIPGLPSLGEFPSLRSAHEL